ncbi:MAG: AAA family ATPase [Acidobacteria bacterium]|nr:AAA family ATPase [Acidobacteriota bacterium]
MLEAYFGFKKTPFGDSPDAKQLFASQAWTQVKARLQFLVDHHGAGLLTGEVGAGKSTAARTFSAGLNPNLYKILYLHWTSGSALDLLRQIALELGVEPAHYRGDLVRQISEAIVHLNRSKKQHPILICDEAQLLRHPALEQLPLLLNFDMDSSHYLTLLLIGEPLLRRTLSLQMHEPLRQRIAVQYHLDGLSREELDGYLAQQLKAAGVAQPLFDDTARQALYQATKGILRKVNKVALTALRLAAARKLQMVGEALLLDATAEALL